MERSFERSFVTAERYIVGVDEAGRGPLAGPVVAAAVVLPDSLQVPPYPINDSKKLSAAQRDSLYDFLTASALAYGIATRGREIIDEMNILAATMQAMTEAVEICLASLNDQRVLVLVDGNYFRSPLSYPYRTVVNGDAQCMSIAAASILAKVTRDRLMCDLDARYPQYGFASHKGYATRRHIEAIKSFGYCNEHRRSFRLRSMEQAELFADN